MTPFTSFTKLSPNDLKTAENGKMESDAPARYYALESVGTPSVFLPCPWENWPHLSADRLISLNIGSFPILEKTTYLISNSLGAVPRGVFDAQ